MQIGQTIEPDRPEACGEWLVAQGASATEIWVVIYKKATGKQRVSYEQLVEVALCHGWIDGLLKGMDAERYAQRFTPRRKRSHWTETNRELVRQLIAAGRMTAAGTAALPDDD